jgi:hypothetical protein
MSKKRDEEILTEVFSTNEPKPRVRMHLRNLKNSCPNEYRGFDFVLQKLLLVLPPEINSKFTISDLDQCSFDICSE